MVSDFLPRRDQPPPKTNSEQTPEQPFVSPFKTPDQVAAVEEQAPDTSSTGPLLTPPPKKKRSLKERFMALSRKQKIIVIALTVLVLIGGGVGVAFALQDKPAPKQAVIKKETPKPAPKPTTVPSTLSGIQVAPEVNDRPVTAVMIENSLDARPQSGVNQASVVFEAVAEGGITRFLTLFQDTQPDYVGPVRSVRPYYIQWALGFDAAIAHAGGSAEGLANMRDWKVKDLNHANDYFWRVSNRFAPHNLYTSIAKLNEYEASKGYGKPNFTGFVRTTAEKPAKVPTAKSIDMAISSGAFNVHYEYDATTNSYKRAVGGTAHLDEKSSAQLSPKVVIGLIMAKGQSDIYSTYNVIGSGQAYVFQDGLVTLGTWKKDSRTSQIMFTDANGAVPEAKPWPDLAHRPWRR